MKKSVFVLISLIAIPFVSISQNSIPTKEDTTCIPNSTLKDAIVLIEEGRIAKKEVELLRQKVDVMGTQLRVKDSTIALFAKREHDLLMISNNFDRYVTNSNAQIENLREINKETIKQVKKERKQKWLIGLSGVLTTALGIALNYYGR